MMNYKKTIFSILVFFFGMFSYAEIDNDYRFLLKGGWYWFEPYQYLSKQDDNNSLTGLDVQISKKIFEYISIDLDIKPLPWSEHLEKIKTGEIDFAAGATYSPERAQYAYFSKPYRYEENSFFVAREHENEFQFSSVSELINYIEKKRLKIGVVAGFVYGSAELNKWIENPNNKDYITAAKEDRENVKQLRNKAIAGFFSDRISGSTAVWRQKAGDEITEIRLGIKTPIHFMFSKVSVSENLVNMVNDSIGKLMVTKDIDRIVSFYFYPVLLLQTVDTVWFRIFEIIGALSLAVSGLVIAYRDKSTLFGAYLLAFLPSLGGSIVRDLVFDRFPVRAMGNPNLFMIVISAVTIAFIIVKINERFHLRTFNFLEGKTWIIHTLALSEALGLAAYTISGIVVSVVVKVDPLWLWGPFFALVTGTGGGILRDLIGRDRDIMALRGGILPEVAVFWGLMLSVFLTYQAHTVDPDLIKYALIVTALGIFLTRLVIYVFNVPNLFLRKPQ